jgi:hypothetical protein
MTRFVKFMVLSMKMPLDNWSTLVKLDPAKTPG